MLESASAPPRPPTKDRIEFSSDEAARQQPASRARGQSHGRLRWAKESEPAARRAPTSVRGPLRFAGWLVCCYCRRSLALPSCCCAFAVAGVAVLSKAATTRQPFSPRRLWLPPWSRSPAPRTCSLPPRPQLVQMASPARQFASSLCSALRSMPASSSGTLLRDPTVLPLGAGCRIVAPLVAPRSRGDTRVAPSLACSHNMGAATLSISSEAELSPSFTLHVAQ